MDCLLEPKKNTDTFKNTVNVFIVLTGLFNCILVVDVAVWQPTSIDE